MPFKKMQVQVAGGQVAHPGVEDSFGKTAMARLVAVGFAGAMLFTVAVVKTPSIHNFAHDTRHTQAFPCH